MDKVLKQIEEIRKRIDVIKQYGVEELRRILDKYKSRYNEIVDLYRLIEQEDPREIVSRPALELIETIYEEVRPYAEKYPDINDELERYLHSARTWVDEEWKWYRTAEALIAIWRIIEEQLIPRVAEEMEETEGYGE